MISVVLLSPYDVCGIPEEMLSSAMLFTFCEMLTGLIRNQNNIRLNIQYLSISMLSKTETLKFQEMGKMPHSQKTHESLVINYFFVLF